MNTNQYTQKTLEALQAAQQLAVEYQHNALEPEHLLHGGDGRPVPVGHAVLPPALAERCTDPRLPAVRSSCVDDVLAVLRKD